MRVAICIGTFRRPKLLGELLDSLSHLTYCRVHSPQIEVIIVDNDPSESARDICRSASKVLPLKYVVEPMCGIAHVRNRAVREGISADYIAFLDDDETVSEIWLDELLSTSLQFNADVVAGPVRPHFARNVPEWAKSSNCFSRREYPTGTLIDKCGTGNVLISTPVFSRVSEFDCNFQLTGGEDTHFFLRVHRAGFRIVWSQEAVAQESVSRDRANLRWILHRGFQSGNSWVLCESLLTGGSKVRFNRFCKAIARVLWGISAAVSTSLFSRSATAQHLKNVSNGIGMLAGLAGQKYQAYNSAKAPFPSKPSLSNPNAH